jgi:hypothetical protein
MIYRELTEEDTIEGTDHYYTDGQWHPVNSTGAYVLIGMRASKHNMHLYRRMCEKSKHQ